MHIHETTTAVDDIAGYGEELNEAELTQVSGGVYWKEGGCTRPPRNPKPKLGGADTTTVV